MAMTQDELNLLLTTAERWFRESNPLTDRVMDFRKGNLQASDSWEKLAEMGWLALPLAEDEGGFEAGYASCFELIRIAGEHARPEALEMYLMFAPIIARACPGLAEALMMGEIRLGVADLARSAKITSRSQGEHCTVSGHSGPVVGAHGATHYIVFGRDADNVLQAGLVAADAEGLELRNGRLLDKRSTVLLVLENTPGIALDERRTGHTAQGLLDLAAVGLVVDAVGVLETSFKVTLDYLKQRTQFGRPLSDLQAVQHKMAEIFCDVKQLTAIVERLGQEMDDSPSGPWPVLPVAKAFVGRRALRGLGQLIQLSGGIGVTEEYQVTHFYRRLHVAASIFGTAEVQLERINVMDTLRSA